MSSRFHPPVEQYLAALYELEEQDIALIQARLAERLQHSAPTVSEVVARLKADGYIESAGRSLEMTKTGRRLAESVVRKHRLAERLLTDVIGLEWHKSHQEADRWEHVISDEVEERLVMVLGHPTTCPHGNPIPGAAAVRQGLFPLSDCDVGDRIYLERVSELLEADFEALRYLDEHGFRPPTLARVQDKAPDGTMTIDVDGTTLALSRAVGDQLYVALA